KHYSFFLHRTFILSFLTLQIRGHPMVLVLGQQEVACEIDFDAVAFADGHRGYDVQELVEDLRGRLRRALCESLAHEVPARRGKSPRSPTLCDSSKGTDG